MEGLRARLKCEPGLLLCSTAATAVFGVGGRVKARPRGLQQMLQEAGFLKGTKAVSALVRALSWTPGLGSVFQCWFYFFLGVHVLLRGLGGAGGVGAMLLSQVAPSQGCDILAVVASTLVRYRAVVLCGTEWALIPPGVHLFWQQQPPPHGEQHQSKGLGQEPTKCWDMCAGCPGKPARTPSSFHCFLRAVTGTEQMCVCVLHKQNLFPAALW